MDIRAKKHRLNAVAALLAAEAAAAGDPQFILAATQVLLDSNWYKSAAKAAPFLVDRIGTAEAIAAAAFALPMRAPQGCSRSARTCRRISGTPASGRVRAPANQLPGGDRRARHCARHEPLAGAHHRPDAGYLAHDSVAPSDRSGPKALALYEEHAQLLTAPAPGHVALARALIWSHPEAARSITRLIAAEAPGDYVTAVLELAGRLKLGAEQRKLAGRLQSLGEAGKGGVRLVTIDDVIELMAERREQAERAMEIYANGHAPVHIFSDFRAGTLASAYLEPLLDPPAPGEPRTLLSARYGRRFDERLIPEARSEARIIVDISALLTAHGLGMLDAVERAFAPVRIAKDAIAALLAMRSDADPSQPERIDAMRGVIARVDAGEIADQTALSTINTFSVLWERHRCPVRERVARRAGSVPRYPQGLLEALLSPEAGDDQRRAAWNLMRHMTGDGPLPANFAEVARAASATAYLGFDSPDRDLARHALLNFAQLATVNGWEEAGERIDAEAARLGPRDDEADAMVLFEIAIWRARLVAHPLERTRTLAKALLRLGAYPLLQEQAEIAARHFARSLSGIETEAFVDILGELFTR